MKVIKFRLLTNILAKFTIKKNTSIIGGKLKITIKVDDLREIGRNNRIFENICGCGGGGEVKINYRVGGRGKEGRGVNLFFFLGLRVQIEGAKIGEHS